MKRVVSMLLIALLVVTLVPTVSNADDEKEVHFFIGMEFDDSLWWIYEFESNITLGAPIPVDLVEDIRNNAEGRHTNMYVSGYAVLHPDSPLDGPFDWVPFDLDTDFVLAEYLHDNMDLLLFANYNFITGTVIGETEIELIEGYDDYETSDYQV
ncbi:MAG: hypothetical protein ACK5LL_01385, partial [Suipraeoptans sp.]